MQPEQGSVIAPPWQACSSGSIGPVKAPLRQARSAPERRPADPRSRAPTGDGASAGERPWLVEWTTCKSGACFKAGYRTPAKMRSRTG